MASTAAGVAVGSSIGHAIGGFFGGGSSSAPVEQAQQPTDAYAHTGNAMDNRLYSQSSSTEAAGPCASDIKLHRLHEPESGQYDNLRLVP